MKRACFPILAALLLHAPAVADEAGQTSLRLITFPRVAGAGPVELQLGDSTVEVAPPANRLSDPVKVPAQDQWRVGRRGDEAFEVWGEARSAGTTKQILILLRKGRNNEDGFKVVCLDDSDKNFGEGDVYLLNLARQEIAGEIGSVKFGLKPSDQIVISPEPDMGPRLCHAALYFRPDKRWRPFFSTNWPLREKTRGLVFIFNRGDTDRVRLHTIRDSL